MFQIWQREEFNRAFLEIDEDSELAKIASPRYSKNLDIHERIKVLVKAFIDFKQDNRTASLRAQRGNLTAFQCPEIATSAPPPRNDECGVALTVEELCPGGLDATDGILIAQALEQAGAKFMIASGGTKDFPALKFRKETQISKSQNNHAWLSSAAWLIGRVDIPVYAQGIFDPNNQDLIKQAKACGFAGLVET